MNKKITDLAVLKSYLPLLNLPKSKQPICQIYPHRPSFHLFHKLFPTFACINGLNLIIHGYYSKALRLHISTYNHTSNECAACQSSTCLKGTLKHLCSLPATLNLQNACSAVQKKSTLENNCCKGLISHAQFCPLL
jgi:hypothetical protein